MCCIAGSASRKGISARAVLARHLFSRIRYRRYKVLYHFKRAPFITVRYLIITRHLITREAQYGRPGTDVHVHVLSCKSGWEGRCVWACVQVFRAIASGSSTTPMDLLARAKDRSKATLSHPTHENRSDLRHS